MRIDCKKLTEKRRSGKYTIRQVAGILDTTEFKYVRIELGAEWPSLKEVSVLVCIFGVEVLMDATEALKEIAAEINRKEIAIHPLRNAKRLIEGGNL